MNNPPDHGQGSGPYVDLLNRITRHVQQRNIDRQILEVVGAALKDELGKEDIILTQSERARLLRQVTRAVLEEMLADFDQAG
ncbi:MAG: hypothetical protein R3335_11140 [Anaerolineales bacterium]|nr:hypothetical protein [Anaerolineales bacterium]